MKAGNNPNRGSEVEKEPIDPLNSYIDKDDYVEPEEGVVDLSKRKIDNDDDFVDYKPTDVKETVLEKEKEVRKDIKSEKRVAELTKRSEEDEDEEDEELALVEAKEKIETVKKRAKEFDEEDEEVEPTDSEDLKDTNNDDDEVDEAALIEPFVDLFHQELGWDIDDESKPKSVSELVEYVKSIVDENAKADFANDELYELNEYVKNGGSVQDYINYTSKQLDIENADLEDLQTQRQLVTMHLKSKGYDDARINRFIRRYEDAGTLEEEAADAHEILKETLEEDRQRLLEEQKQEQQERIQEQREFFTNVQNEIQKLDDVRGIPISKQDKAALLNYVFRQDADGVTQYQKDYYKNLSKNLIESAYFTMKGDKFLSQVQSKVKTDAVKELKRRLQSAQKPVKNTQRIDLDSEVKIWDVIGNI